MTSPAPLRVPGRADARGQDRRERPVGWRLGRLLLIVENYPQLKSNENFLRLQDELAGTENRIAVERKRYNDAIQDYNTYIGLFPNDIFRGGRDSNATTHTSAAPEVSREAPKVQFPAPSR